MKWVYTILLAIAIILLFWVFNKKEGFETLQDKLQDRANPLAAITNPLLNPATAIGIPESVGASMRNMGITAFNSTSSVTQPPISQRIDNENSLLGMIQFCKNNAAGDSPFSDPTFNASCGVCITSGTLLTGEKFTTPTGVLVYPQDKSIAIAKQKKVRGPFPHVVPSMKAATCEGASMGDDAKPVLAITQRDYRNFIRLAACQHKAGFDVNGGCAMCLTEKSWTYIDPDIQGPSVDLLLWGLGQASVLAGGRQIGGTVTLDTSAVSKISLGPIAEGTSLQIDIKQADEQAPACYVYGAIRSILPTGGIYSLDIAKFIDVDSVSNTFVRHGLPVSFTEVSKYLDKLMPGLNEMNMKIQGAIPLTFIEEDNIASYVCDNSPFVSTEQAYNKIVDDDPCTNPAGQRPGNYQDLCLQSVLKNAGCSAAGKWYQNPAAVAGSMSLNDFKNWLVNKMSKSVADPDISIGCSGVDTSTPCDSFINNPTAVPDAKCLAFIYSNNSQKSYIGSGYTLSTSKSSPSGPYNFCRADAPLNPANPNGAAILSGIAKNGYNGTYGIESIKNYLSDMYNKATNTNLNPLVDDSAGGNKTSLLNCLNVVAAPPPPAPAVVSTCSPLSGSPVYVAGVVGSSSWTRWPQFESGFPTNPGSYWIYGTPNSQASAAVGPGPTVSKVYNNTSGRPLSVTIYCSFDDTGTVSMNGQVIINNQITSVMSAPYTLQPGCTRIDIAPSNNGGPAGLIFTMIDSNNNVLVQSDSSWTITGASVSVSNSVCPSLSGSPVHVSGTLGSSQWTRWPQFESGFPTNPGTYWIYGTPNSQFSAAPGRGATVSKIYNNTSGGSLPVIVYCSFDDTGTVSMNGQVIINNQLTSVMSTPYILQPGCTRIDISPSNNGGPAGLIFAMFDINNNALLQSDATWTITG